MLALTRKKGESIIINDNIEVVVIGIQGEQIKLGVIAPKHIHILRKEIYELIQKENKLANENIENADLSQIKNLLNN